MDTHVRRRVVVCTIFRGKPQGCESSHPPQTDFQSPIAPQPRGCEKLPTRLRKALNEIFPNHPLLHWYPPDCGATELSKQISGGVMTRVLTVHKSTSEERVCISGDLIGAGARTFQGELEKTKLRSKAKSMAGQVRRRKDTETATQKHRRPNTPQGLKKRTEKKKESDQNTQEK